MTKYNVVSVRAWKEWTKSNDLQYPPKEFYVANSLEDAESWVIKHMNESPRDDFMVVKMDYHPMSVFKATITVQVNKL